MGTYLTVLNQTLVHPLPVREVAGIAKSVARYARENLTSDQTQVQFSQLQAARGRKGGRISGAKRYPESNEAERPWEVAGVSRATWYRHDYPKTQESTEQQRPWEAVGVSRRTWYRDRAQAKPKAGHGGVRR